MTPRSAAPVFLRSAAPVSLHRAGASAAAVWDVLSDGWTYASWVVGASRVRDVEDPWPAVGSRLHHSFGPWPLVISDHTQVLECEPRQCLMLRARGWPTGEATVRISLQPVGRRHATIPIEEDVTAGPARLIPVIVRQALTVPRNRETLRRLALLAAGRSSGRGPAA